MTRYWDTDIQRWYVTRSDGLVINWFETELEAHCYEVEYHCDGTECPDVENCPCYNGGCC